MHFSAGKLIVVSSTLLIIASLLGLYIFNFPEVSAFSQPNAIQSIDELKRRIERDYPRLKDPHISDVERLNLIREWTSTQVPWGSASTNMNVYYAGRNVEQIFSAFGSDAGSVNCGIASNALKKLYEAYGYTAYTYHSGSLDDFNHAITLVKTKYNNREILMIQDPSWDVTYTDGKNNPLDFYEFLQKIKQKKSDKIKIAPGKAKPHYYICDAKDYCNKPQIKTSIIPISDNRIKFHEKFSPRTLIENINSYLIFRKIDAQNNTEEKQMQQKIQGIIDQVYRF